MSLSVRTLFENHCAGVGPVGGFRTSGAQRAGRRRRGPQRRGGQSKVGRIREGLRHVRGSDEATRCHFLCAMPYDYLRTTHFPRVGRCSPPDIDDWIAARRAERRPNARMSPTETARCMGISGRSVVHSAQVRLFLRGKEGLRVESDFGPVKSWEQPILRQAGGWYPRYSYPSESWGPSLSNASEGRAWPCE